MPTEATGNCQLCLLKAWEMFTIKWSTESYSADYCCDIAWLPAPVGIFPEYEPSTATTEPICSKLTHTIHRWTKPVFPNQALETVCLCWEASLCFFPPQVCVTTLEKKRFLKKKKSGKQFHHSCFCFSLTYLMFLLVPLGERKRLSFCISWLFPSVSLPPPPDFSHLLLCMNACCTIYFCNV